MDFIKNQINSVFTMMNSKCQKLQSLKRRKSKRDSSVYFSKCKKLNYLIHYIAIIE